MPSSLLALLCVEWIKILPLDHRVSLSNFASLVTYKKV